MNLKIYGIDNCQWCEKARVLLNRTGVPFEYIHIEDHQKASFMDGFIMVHGGDRTFPRVVYGDSHQGEQRLVGGFDQLLEEVLHGRIS